MADEQLPAVGQTLRECLEEAQMTEADLAEYIVIPPEPFVTPLRNIRLPLLQSLPPTATPGERMAIVIRYMVQTNKVLMSRDLLPEFLSRCFHFFDGRVDEKRIGALAADIGCLLMAPWKPGDAYPYQLYEPPDEPPDS